MPSTEKLQIVCGALAISCKGMNVVILNQVRALAFSTSDGITVLTFSLISLPDFALYI